MRINVLPDYSASSGNFLIEFQAETRNDKAALTEMVEKIHFGDMCWDTLSSMRRTPGQEVESATIKVPKCRCMK